MCALPLPHIHSLTLESHGCRVRPSHHTPDAESVRVTTHQMPSPSESPHTTCRVCPSHHTPDAESVRVTTHHMPSLSESPHTRCRVCPSHHAPDAESVRVTTHQMPSPSESPHTRCRVRPSHHAAGSRVCPSQSKCCTLLESVSDSCFGFTGCNPREGKGDRAGGAR